jgi:hypothetical protein
MGTITVVINVTNVSDSQVATIKSALDAQVQTWQTNYPSLGFSRGNVQWNE